MSQPVASRSPLTSPPTCAAVRNMLSRSKVVGVHPAACAPVGAATNASASETPVMMTNALRMLPPFSTADYPQRTKPRDLADATLRAWHALSTGISLRRGVERAPERFERGLEQVVGVAAADLRDVKRAARALHQRDEEIGHERRIEGADDAGLRRQVVREVRPPTEVERDADEALVHRQLERRVTHQTLAVAERRIDRG